MMNGWLKRFGAAAGKLADKIFKGDKVIWVIVFLLSLLSIAAVYSSSSFRAAKDDVSKFSLFFEQIMFVAGGWVLLLLASRIHPKWYRKLSFVGSAAVISLMFLLFFDGLTAKQNGAIRGIKLFGFTIQIFEFAKAAIIIYLARAMEVFDKDSLKNYLVWLLVPILLTCGLLMRGSFSVTLFMAAICFMILWLNKVRIKFLVMTMAAAAGLVLGGYGLYKISSKIHEDNPKEIKFARFATAESRFEDFFGEITGKADRQFEEMSEKEKKDYIDSRRQSENAKIAIKEGGIFGKGPGNSTQRYVLSMAFSDFIFAFIIEEYGLITGIALMMLYIWLFARCAQISVKCKSTFASTTVFGLGLLISMQALMHILVNVRLLPVTGHTLPLVSHGGTAFLAFCIVFGIILSVSREVSTANNKTKEESHENNN